MAEDLREDSGEYYPGGTVVPGVPGVPGGGGSSVIVDDALTKDGENPVKSKGIWSAIWGAIAAPAASVYAWVTTELKKKVDKNSQTIVIGENSDASSPCSQGSVVIGTNASSSHGSGVAIGNNAKANGNSQSYPLAVAIGAGAIADEDVPICIGGKDGLRLKVYADGSMYVGDVMIVRKSDLEDYAKTAEVLPRYPFVDAGFNWVEEFTEATITIAPYTNAVKDMSNYPDAAYTIKVADGDDVYCRDCVLRLEVPAGISAPKLMWGTNFHPRTDVEADFACVAGVRNVYWITEHAPGEFTVAGWQETTGGGE